MDLSDDMLQRVLVALGDDPLANELRRQNRIQRETAKAHEIVNWMDAQRERPWWRRAAS